MVDHLNQIVISKCAHYPFGKESWGVEEKMKRLVFRVLSPFQRNCSVLRGTGEDSLKA